MTQLLLRSCSSPVCQPAPCLRRCPYEAERAHARFRRDVRRGKRVGPLAYFDGLWAVEVEGWRPWPEMERESTT